MDLLKRYEKWQRAAGRSESTRLTSSRVLKHFISSTGADPKDFTAQNAVDFLASESFSKNTRAAYFWHISSYAKWLILTGQRTDMPLLGMPRPKVSKRPPRPVSPDDLAKLLGQAGNARVRMMILLGAFQGLRVHEIAKVHTRDLDMYERSMEVSGKGGKVALLPLHDEILKAMDTMPDKGYWFESSANPGQPIQAGSVSKAVSKVMRLAGVPGTPHALRHFFGTQLVRSGVNLRVVQELMRHSTVATTEHYIQVQATEMRTALAELRMAA